MNRYGFLILLLHSLSMPLWGGNLPHSSFTMKLRGFVPKIYDQRETVYSIYSPNGDFSFPETANQRTLGSKINGQGKNIYLRAGKNLLQKQASKSLKKFTTDSYLLTLKDKNIVATAKILKKSKYPLFATALFVHGHIEHKTMGIALIPATTIFKNRSGDCTEHSVLTVSLLRAMGIPARAVVGVLLARDFGQEHNIFVYHMWVEAFHGGRWHIVDATRPHGVRPNRYIAFAYHSLLSEVPLDYLKQMGAIYGMKISYLRGK